MMYVALSYDHRIVDGREAVTFLVRIKECLEDPVRLVLDLGRRHADRRGEGVKIQLFAQEHAPPHAVQAEHRAQIESRSLKVLKCGLPPGKMAIAISCAEPRREALLNAWNAVLPSKSRRR